MKKLAAIFGALILLLPAIAISQRTALAPVAFEAIPSTVVTSATTTSSLDLDGSTFSAALIHFKVTALIPSQTVTLHFEVYDPASSGFVSFSKTNAITSAVDTMICVFAPNCTNFAADVVTFKFFFPNRYRLSVVTTTADSVTFAVSVIPLF